MQQKDRVNQANDAFNLNLALGFSDKYKILGTGTGEFIFDMRDAETGESLVYWKRPQIVTYDAGILAAMLFSDPNSRPLGCNMLAVGTGAPGPILSPNAADPRERKLFSEIDRKAFSSVVFRDGSGNAVAYPTNVVDFTTVFSASEAVGPLNEMGLMATLSANPNTLNLNPNAYPTRDTTVDVSDYDILVNCLNFSVVSKPATATLGITWRLTF